MIVINIHLALSDLSMKCTVDNTFCYACIEEYIISVSMKKAVDGCRATCIVLSLLVGWQAYISVNLSVTNKHTIV